MLLTGRHGYDHVKPRTSPSPIGLLDVIGHSQFMSVLEQNWVILQARWPKSQTMAGRHSHLLATEYYQIKKPRRLVRPRLHFTDLAWTLKCRLLPDTTKQLVKIQFDAGHGALTLAVMECCFKHGPYPYHKTTVYASNNMIFTVINDPSGRSAISKE